MMARLLLSAILGSFACVLSLAENETLGKDLLLVTQEPQGFDHRRLQAVAVEKEGWSSPNPPSCVVEFADLLSVLTFATQALIGSMISCPPVFAEGVLFEEQERACALPILNILTNLADAVSDVEALAFDCFDQNQACGQAIASACGDMFDVAIALTAIIGICPWTRNEAGFICWARIWNVVQLLVEAAKFIDVALGTCPITRELSKPTPTPAPQPVPTEKTPTPIADEGKKPQAKLFAASYAGMLPVFGAGVERRLRASDSSITNPQLLEARLMDMQKQSNSSTTLLDEKAKREFADILIEVLKHFNHAFESVVGNTTSSSPPGSRDLNLAMENVKRIATVHKTAHGGKEVLKSAETPAQEMVI